MEIEDVSAIVTGAASGIGRTIAIELLRSRANVVAVDVNARGLEALQQESMLLPGRLVAAAANVADEAAVVKVVKLAATGAKVNVLVNNAGVVQDGLLVQRANDAVISLPSAQWRRVLEINLEGAFLMAREFATVVLEARTELGVIVNISSIVSGGNMGQSNYAAAKAGLESCTRTWAQELAPHGIRVGCVSPGVIETPMLSHISEAALTDYRRRIWLGRFGKSQDIWQAVRFVIECEYFTGRSIQVDGGLTI
jgi:3-oxoacyl-[acyl-carrier protein] reductase